MQKPLYAIFALLVFFEFSASSAEPYTCHWTGDAKNGNWGDAGNWAEGVVPGQGIALKEVGCGRLHGEAVITVPEGVDGLKVQFRLHPDPGTTCGFDKVFLGKIDFAKPVPRRH